MLKEYVNCEELNEKCDGIVSSLEDERLALRIERVEERYRNSVVKYGIIWGMKKAGKVLAVPAGVCLLLGLGSKFGYDEGGMREVGRQLGMFMGVGGGIYSLATTFFFTRYRRDGIVCDIAQEKKNILEGEGIEVVVGE